MKEYNVRVKLYMCSGDKLRHYFIDRLSRSAR